jgi:pimeloyl-ACP methyl ester carboxylesterase
MGIAGIPRERTMTIWLNASFEMQYRVIDGLTIRFARSEARSQHALLLSPWPESLLAFVPVWSWLAERAHLVAIDLPGFGHSQRSDALLSPRAMAEFVLRAADAFELDRPHLLGPGTGTAAALFAAARDPGRLRSLVVGSGAAAVPLQLGGTLKEWVEASDLEEFRRADPRRLLDDALSSVGQCALDDPVRQDYLSSYQGNRMAESMRYVRSYPAELPVLSGLLPQIGTPVQIIAGLHDTAVPAVNAEYLHQRLPHSKLDVIDAGHLTWEDAPDEYAGLVSRWWDGGCDAARGERPGLVPLKKSD